MPAVNMISPTGKNRTDASDHQEAFPLYPRKTLEEIGRNLGPKKEKLWNKESKYTLFFALGIWSEPQADG